MNPIRFILPLALVFSLTSISAADDAATAFKSRVHPLLATYCTECHGVTKQKAKINFTLARNLEQLAADRELWFRALTQLEFGMMPPAEEKQPTPAERAAIIAWVRGEFTELQIARQHKEGRSKLRRLSRIEYANTVQDLFGIRPPVTLTLPADGRVDGYDKVSAAVPLAASGAWGYLKMSDDLLKWVLRYAGKPKAGAAEPGQPMRYAARPSEQSAGHILELPDGTKVSFNTDTTSGPFAFPGTRIPGIHHIKFSVYGYQTDKPMAFGVYTGHTGAYPQLIDLVKILEAPPGKPAVVEADIYLRTRDFNDIAPIGDGLRLIPFGLGVQVPKNFQASKCRGPGLAVQWMEVEEPATPLLVDRFLTADLPRTLDDEMRRAPQLALPKSGSKKNPPKGPSRDEFLISMKATFKRVGARLYRRDLTAAELGQITDDIARQIDGGAPLETAFFDQITEMMTSPDFLCVIEPPGQLSDFALASRLSYFLWNSTPDGILLDLARKGKLHLPKVLKEQTDRLLNDPKSSRFINDFVDQWLGLRMINDTTPDRKIYPEYDDLLKLSSVMETQAFFRRVLDENLSVRNFAASDWVLVNEPLAKHYGLPALSGMQLQKVTLPKDSPYGGIWTQSAVMKVTANGTHTSPVKRGVWVAERLLGIPISPPPPNIKPIEPDVRGAKTLREQLALHRTGASCAACHAKFDPYGFALESFDVTGGFRTKYREVDPDIASLPANQRQGRPTWRDGLPVDCSGQTPDGHAFTGIAELRQLLSKNPEQLARGVTRHLITYATGAPATPLDQAAIDAIVKSTAAEDYGLRSIVHAVVQSEVFRWK
jgi:hypothetical protein